MRGRGECAVVEGIGAAAMTAVIEELRAGRTVWESQAAVLERVVLRGRAGRDIAWHSPAGEVYEQALDAWVRDGTRLVDAAGQVLAALRAHEDALVEVRDVVASAEAAVGDAIAGPIGVLPELLAEGGLL